MFRGCAKIISAKHINNNLPNIVFSCPLDEIYTFAFKQNVKVTWKQTGKIEGGGFHYSKIDAMSGASQPTKRTFFVAAPSQSGISLRMIFIYLSSFSMSTKRRFWMEAAR